MNRAKRCLRVDRLANAFTLVELIIVMLIVVVLGGALLTTFLSGQTAYVTADASVIVQEEARKALDIMTRELREAGPSTGVVAADIQIVPGALLALAPYAASDQLNFRVARDYNQLASCPGAICWGSEFNLATDWIHYAVIDNGAAIGPNRRQLIRCVTAGNLNKTTVLTAGNIGGLCVVNGNPTIRVLANNVNNVSFNAAGLNQCFGPPSCMDTNGNTFPDTVIINISMLYRNPQLKGTLVPGLNSAMQLGTPAVPLTTRVKLRNEGS